MLVSSRKFNTWLWKGFFTGKMFPVKLNALKMTTKVGLIKAVNTSSAKVY